MNAINFERPAALSARQRRAIQKVLDSADTRFTSLVRSAGLNPGEDLKAVNLNGIRIYPDEDLSGYDFSGASLKNADLKGVDLTGAVAEKTDFSLADLRGARLTAPQRRAAIASGARVGRWRDHAGRAKRLIEAREFNAVQEAIRRSPIVAAAFAAFPEAELVGWTIANGEDSVALMRSQQSGTTVLA